MKLRLSEIHLFLVLGIGLAILGIVSCSHQQGRGDRYPAGEEAADLLKSDSCKQLIAPLIDESFVLSKGDWDPEVLAKQEKLDLDSFDTMRTNPDWQRFIARAEQSDEERDMAFVILSLMRKRFPTISDDRLKDRYKVFMAFCGA